MKRWRTAAAVFGAAVTGLAIASVPSGASEPTATKCKITAQPWKGHYNLSVELHDGSTVKLIDAEQHDRYETPSESFTFEVGEVAYVLWAQTKYPATGHDSWGDVLKVDQDSCAWADGVHYGAQPNKRDSVIIEAVEMPVPSTPSTSTTPTTEAPTTTVPVSTPSTEVPEPVPPTTEPELPPATEPPVTEAPPTTVAEPPAASSNDTPIKVERRDPFPEEPPVFVPPSAGREPIPPAPPVTPTTVYSSPTLPFTGAWTQLLAFIGGTVVLAGGMLMRISRGHRTAG